MAGYKLVVAVLLLLVVWRPCLSQPPPPGPDHGPIPPGPDHEGNCPDGRHYDSCGTACPRMCENYRDDALPCIEICVEACYCHSSQVEHNGQCIDPEDCPIPEPPPVSGGNQTEEPCEDNGHCRKDEYCEVEQSGCGPEDDYCYTYAICRKPAYVPCGQDAFLACDSEWTYCLQQNKTRRATCVADCFSRNGNCPEDEICVTAMSEGDESPRLQCVDTEDLPTDCPAGQVRDPYGCPSVCQDTCEDVLRGTPTACILVCGPPELCFCPRGLVLFRDRCVDPRLCYVLLSHPPAIDPLPIVDRNTVLISLYSDDVNSRQLMLRDNQRVIIRNIRTVLTSNGYDNVEVSIHGAHEEDGEVEVVVQISGDGISRSSISNLLEILSQNTGEIGVPVQQFGQVDVDYVSGDDEVLSRDAIIGIAVSSVVAGIAIVVAWIAAVCCCCVLKSKKKRTMTSSGKLDFKSNQYTNILFHEEDLNSPSEPEPQEQEEDKAVKLENLCE